MKRWKPKVEETYYIIKYFEYWGFDYAEMGWYDGTLDELYFKHHNCFRTKREVKRIIRMFKQILKKGLPLPESKIPKKSKRPKMNQLYWTIERLFGENFSKKLSCEKKKW